MVFVIVPVGAELAIAQALVEVDGASVILADFQAHDDTASVHRLRFCFPYQFFAHALATHSRRHRNGVDSGEPGGSAHQNQAVAHQLAIGLGHNQAVSGHLQKAAEATPGKPVFGEAPVFEQDQGVEILAGGLSELEIRH